MTLRNTIKKILKEDTKQNRRYDKFAYNVIKYAHDNIRNYFIDIRFKEAFDCNKMNDTYLSFQK